MNCINSFALLPFVALIAESHTEVAASRVRTRRNAPENVALARMAIILKDPICAVHGALHTCVEAKKR